MTYQTAQYSVFTLYYFHLKAKAVATLFITK